MVLHKAGQSPRDAVIRKLVAGIPAWSVGT